MGRPSGRRHTNRQSYQWPEWLGDPACAVGGGSRPGLTLGPVVRVAVVQFDATGSRSAVRDRAVAAIETAADDGAVLVVLPEYASGWASVPGPDLAEPVDGPFAAAIRGAARRCSVGVVAGMVTSPEGLHSHAANLALAIGPDGAVLGRYVKVHLFDAFGFRESDALVAGSPGAQPLVFEVGGLRFGVLTCYDIRFPESARRLVDGGAEALVVIAAWASGPGKAEQLSVLARARAIENTAYLLLASQCGTGRAGFSAAVDPAGVVLVHAGPREETTLIVDLDRAVVDETRARVPVLANRRYGVVPLT